MHKKTFSERLTADQRRQLDEAQAILDNPETWADMQKALDDAEKALDNPDTFTEAQKVLDALEAGNTAGN